MDGSPERARPVRTPGLPGIAIVTPCYQSADYLEDAIVSVLDQGYPALEYVVVDGGSTDGSVEIIERYADGLTSWVSEPDQGQYHALNKGFAKTTGEVMGYLNADDVLMPGVLFVVAEIFREFPDVEWLSGAHVAIRERGAPMSVIRPTRWSRWHFLSDRMDRHLPQESTFWRRALWERAGGRFDERFRLAGDFELWARFSRHTRPAVIDAPIGCFRFVSGQRSVVHRERYEAEVAEIRARERATSTPDRAGARLASALLALAPPSTWRRRRVDAVLGGSPVIEYVPEGGYRKYEGSAVESLVRKGLRVAGGQERLELTPAKVAKFGRDAARAARLAAGPLHRSREVRRRERRQRRSDRAVGTRRDYRAAFHGDRVYRAMIDEVIRGVPVGTFVETGTYLGDSSGYVAARHPGVQVHSCDISRQVLDRAATRLWPLGNAHLHHASSERFVRGFLSRGRSGVPMFFLDAHWNAYWPLEDELGAIAGSGVPAVVVVDDFQVPGRPDLGFDVWEVDGRSRACDLSLVSGQLPPGNEYRLLVPDYRAEDGFHSGEDILLRGHLVLFQNLTEAHDRLTAEGSILARHYRPIEPGSSGQDRG